MDLRELQRENREHWRILDRLTEALEELSQQASERRSETKAIRALLKILGTEEEPGLLAAIQKMPPEVAAKVADKLNSDAIDLIRHVRYWLGELNKIHPGAAPEALPPVPPAGSGQWAVAQSPPRDDPHTGVFDLVHTDGEKRKRREVVGGVVIWAATHLWKSGALPMLLKTAATGGFLAAAMHWLQKLHP